MKFGPVPPSEALGATSGRLIAPFGGPVEANGAYYLVWPHSKARHTPLGLFRDWLMTQAQPEDPLPR